MTYKKLSATVKINTVIEIDPQNVRRCGYSCPHWDTKSVTGKNEKTAFCIFGALRWCDDDNTYRHVNCRKATKDLS